jgi:hypothetical protein
MKTSIERSDIEKTLIDGFFPFCDMNDDPVEDTEGWRARNQSDVCS